MSRRRRLAAAILALLVGAPLAGEDPGPAPKGFAWKKIDSVKAAFLMPKGWYFKEEAHAGTRAFFITRERIADKEGRFETGLTVNVIFGKDKAQERALSFIAGLAKLPGHELQEAWETEIGVLKGTGARIRKTEEPHPPLIMHELAIGNSRTDTLYIILFESPEAKWDEAWRKGEVILKHFLLDDEI